MNSLDQQPGINFKLIFESAPDLYLLLSKELKIIDANNKYLQATLTKRDEITGKHIFEVFPDNPDDPHADGVSNLHASLLYVLENKRQHEMPVQKYDIKRPDGVFEERYWRPRNSPVMSTDGSVEFIIHRVEDVTEMEQLKHEANFQQMQYYELRSLQKTQAEQLKKSESHFFTIFSLSPIALSMSDISNGKYIYVNRAFEELFEMKSKDILGKTAVELGITDVDKRAETLNRLYENGGYIYGFETELGVASGKSKKMLVSIELIEFDYSNYLLASLVDITQRKKMEEELKNTNKFLDTILDNIPNMIFVKDAEQLRFLRFNHAGEKLLGYSQQELNGKNDYDFFPKEQADFFTGKDKEVIANKTLVDIEEEPISTKSGEHWLHTKKIPVYENEKALYLVGISEDITENKKQKDAIFRLNKELESFTYTVSHDLRAPLRAISGFSKMLMDDYQDELDNEGKRLLNIISSNAEKMGKLIDELLSFSRLGKKEIMKQATDMNKLTESLVYEHQYNNNNNKTNIIIHNLHNIQSDPILMKQVMTNLISNAVKYSSKKDVPEIIIQSALINDQVVFSIKDNGVGFDMKYAKKLFGVFQRLHSEEEFEGTGVGLAIVQRIVHKHGGKIWAEAKENEGATFYFSLPIN